MSEAYKAYVAELAVAKTAADMMTAFEKYALTVPKPVPVIPTTDTYVERTRLLFAALEKRARGVGPSDNP